MSSDLEGDGQPMTDPAVSPAAGAGAAAGQSPGDVTAELARVQAERDAAVAALAAEGNRQRKGGRTRRITVGVLIVLFAIVLPVTYVVAWAHYVVLSNRGFERT